ncbi:MAG: hypothetical protein PHS24_03695 [Bacilli bacterium]|nr:hypothetical protein [Bacilli bacterium]
MFLKKEDYITYIVYSIGIILFNISFAYFLAHINGAETSITIESDSGIMQMQYDGGDEITVTSFSPSATAFATKNFTITGTNNTNEIMDYNIN